MSGELDFPAAASGVAEGLEIQTSTLVRIVVFSMRNQPELSLSYVCIGCVHVVIGCVHVV